MRPVASRFLSYDELLYLKRLQKKERDHFKIISDNTNHPAESIRVDHTHIQDTVLLAWRAHLARKDLAGSEKPHGI